MRIKAGGKSRRNESDGVRRTGSYILLCGLLAVIGSAGVMARNIDVSRASLMPAASVRTGRDFVALSLNNSSAIAARFAQRRFATRYDAALKSSEMAIPVPPARPAIERPDVGRSLRAQPACMTGGLFEGCLGFMDFLESRQQAWPRFAEVALPDAAGAGTTGGVPEATIASARATADMAIGGVVAAVDRPERRAGEVIVGAASTYNPYDAGDNDAGGAETASGELYDPIGWTAAIQTDLRAKFAGVRYGRLYQPSFALVELNGKRAIVRINDVGPLRPGRVIDLSTQVMHYFDPSLRRGVLDGVLVTPLIGSDWTPGPLGLTPAVAMASN